MLINSGVQRGFTLVELMVAVVVGMLAIMGITQFLASRLSGNADLLEATQLNQELCAIIDLTESDIRSGGYGANVIGGVRQQGTLGVLTNPLQSITVGTTVNPLTATTGNAIQYAYDINGNGSIDDNENSTIHLNATTHAVELVQGIANPITTALSDTGTTTITALNFSLAPAALTISCVGTGSNPTLTVRELTISVTGQLASDSTVTRTMQQTVRIRADSVLGICAAIIS